MLAECGGEGRAHPLRAEEMPFLRTRFDQSVGFSFMMVVPFVRELEKAMRCPSA
jgi:hypothetical protein